MEFAPLYKLFTTKVDRMAVYKLIMLGTRRKGGDFMSRVDKIDESGYGAKDETVSTPQTNNQPDKTLELAKQTGIDALVIKQYTFCDLMTKTQNPSALTAEPFMCTTVEEIDALGKKIFGYLWEDENAKSETTYTVEFDNKTFCDLLTEMNLKGIASPLVYMDMFGSISNYAGFGICTMVACVATGFHLSRDIKRGFNLRGYLNNDSDRYVDKEFEKQLEQVFFFNLLYCRVNRGMGCAGNDFPRRSPSTLIRPSVPNYVVKYATPELWETYRSALLECDKCCEGWPLITGIEDVKEADRFFVDEIWFRYLRNDWTHLVTSSELFSKEDYDGDLTRMYVVADMDEYYKAMRGEENSAFQNPVSFAADSFDRIYDIDDLPKSFDRVKNFRVLSYTGGLCRTIWDWGLSYFDRVSGYRYVVNGKHKNFEHKPKMLITSSCLVSTLIRAGVELYFAFRSEEYCGEPLVLYVDNEKDKEFVEECAKSVGVTLGDGKNSVVMLEDAVEVRQEIDELDASLDTLTKRELFEETYRCYLLMLMTTSGDKYSLTERKGYRGEVYYSWRNVENDSYDYLGKRALFTNDKNLADRRAFYTSDGNDFTRNVVDIGRLLVSCEAVAYGIKDGKKELFSSKHLLNNDVYAVVFPFASVIYASVTSERTGYSGQKYEVVDNNCSLITPLPFIVKNGLCKYVRWSEIPALVPALADAWSVIDALPYATLCEYISVKYKMDMKVGV